MMRPSEYRFLAGTAITFEIVFLKAETDEPSDPERDVRFVAVHMLGERIEKAYGRDPEVVALGDARYEARDIVLMTPGIWKCGGLGPPGWVPDEECTVYIQANHLLP